VFPAEEAASHQLRRRARPEAGLPTAAAQTDVFETARRLMLRRDELLRMSKGGYLGDAQDRIVRVRLGKSNFSRLKYVIGSVKAVLLRPDEKVATRLLLDVGGGREQETEIRYASNDAFAEDEAQEWLARGGKV